MSIHNEKISRPSKTWLQRRWHSWKMASFGRRKKCLRKSWKRFDLIPSRHAMVSSRFSTISVVGGNGKTVSIGMKLTKNLRRHPLEHRNCGQYEESI
jgi:hypothetical protein